MSRRTLLKVILLGDSGYFHFKLFFVSFFGINCFSPFFLLQGREDLANGQSM